jgi:hypothetical protein
MRSPNWRTRPAGYCRPPARQPTPSKQGDAAEIRRMSDALANARREAGPVKGDATLKRPCGQEEPAPALVLPARELRYARDKTSDDEVLQSGALPPLAGQCQSVIQAFVPLASPPIVDAAAFASIIARLWELEMAKGSNAVHVHFGAAGWPATGARLVRAADGTVDITLHIDAGCGDEIALARSQIQDAMAKRGIAVGRFDLVPTGGDFETDT